MKIRIYGDPCLRAKSQPVKSVGPAERLLIKSLLQTMYDAKGVGLAAPQVGINQQIFVADAGDGPIAVINPKTLKKSGSEAMDEGCLSIPGVQVKVKRPKTIAVEYRDENGQVVRREMTELLARVFQHETDHLFGKLIVDYAGVRAKKKLEPQLEALQAGSKALK